MASKTYKMLELVGTSDRSFEDAINGALRRAAKTMRQLDWFEVKEMRGAVGKGKVSQYQVKLQVGFRLEEGE